MRLIWKTESGADFIKEVPFGTPLKDIKLRNKYPYEILMSTEEVRKAQRYGGATAILDYIASASTSPK